MDEIKCRRDNFSAGHGLTQGPGKGSYAFGNCISSNLIGPSKIFIVPRLNWLNWIESPPPLHLHQKRKVQPIHWFIDKAHPLNFSGLTSHHIASLIRLKIPLDYKL